MTLFDSIQNMVFGKKKSKDDIVENDALGKVTPVAASTKVETSERIEGEDADFSVEDLKKAISLQKEQNKKIEDSIKKYQMHVIEYDKAKRSLADSTRQLEKQKKEYLQVINHPNVDAKQKSELQKILKEIDKGLAEIKDNGRKNEKFIIDVRYAIKESEKAIRVNEKALEQNEKALKAAEDSKGAIKITAKDIGELQKQVEHEEKISIPRKDSTFDTVTGSTEPGNLGVAQSGGQIRTQMKDDDYWEKGTIK